jgi:hypothetical protein
MYSIWLYKGRQFSRITGVFPVSELNTFFPTATNYREAREEMMSNDLPIQRNETAEKVIRDCIVEIMLFTVNKDGKSLEQIYKRMTSRLNESHDSFRNRCQGVSMYMVSRAYYPFSEHARFIAALDLSNVSQLREDIKVSLSDAQDIKDEYLP